MTGRGGLNTSRFRDVTLIGLYNMINNDNFLTYHERVLSDNELEILSSDGDMTWKKELPVFVFKINA